jgi:hypothetical protein
MYLPDQEINQRILQSIDLPFPPNQVNANPPIKRVMV